MADLTILIDRSATTNMKAVVTVTPIKGMFPNIHFEITALVRSVAYRGSAWLHPLAGVRSIVEEETKRRRWIDTDPAEYVEERLTKWRSDVETGYGYLDQSRPCSLVAGDRVLYYTCPTFDQWSRNGYPSEPARRAYRELMRDMLATLLDPALPHVGRLNELIAAAENAGHATAVRAAVADAYAKLGAALEATKAAVLALAAASDGVVSPQDEVFVHDLEAALRPFYNLKPSSVTAEE